MQHYLSPVRLEGEGERTRQGPSCDDHKLHGALHCSIFLCSIYILFLPPLLIIAVLGKTDKKNTFRTRHKEELNYMRKKNIY
jgi:hypothetical protein